MIIYYIYKSQYYDSLDMFNVIISNYLSIKDKVK